jgi:ParB family chromosome partitioning protein
MLGSIKGSIMVKKRGLGKSLDALLVGSLAISEEPYYKAAEKLSQISVDLIQRGKYQPRREIDTDALEDLASSIRAQGIIQPIVLRQILGGRYEIVAGERRWHAAKLAGLTEIPALVRDIPDEAAIAIALIENIQREGLNPIEEAFALQRLIDEFAMTHQQLADAVGKSRTSVTNLLRLLSLAEEVKAMLEHGDIEMGHARSLLTLPEALQIEAARNIVNKGLSVRDTEELVRQLQLPKLPAMPKSIDPDIRRLQEDLATRLNLAVAIQCSPKGKGKVTIRYGDIAELDAILSYFQ